MSSSQRQTKKRRAMDGPTHDPRSDSHSRAVCILHCIFRALRIALLSFAVHHCCPVIVCRPLCHCCPSRARIQAALRFKRLLSRLMTSHRRCACTIQQAGHDRAHTHGQREIKRANAKGFCVCEVEATRTTERASGSTHCSRLRSVRSKNNDASALMDLRTRCDPLAPHSRAPGLHHAEIRRYRERKIGRSPLDWIGDGEDAEGRRKAQTAQGLGKPTGQAQFVQRVWQLQFLEPGLGAEIDFDRSELRRQRESTERIGPV